MKLRVLSASALAVAAFLFVNAHQSSTAAPVKPALLAQGGIPPQPRSCTKKINPQPCTACSELNKTDAECVSGTEFLECTSSYITCQNGVQCDANVGSGQCP